MEKGKRRRVIEVLIFKKWEGSIEDVPRGEILNLLTRQHLAGFLSFRSCSGDRRRCAPLGTMLWRIVCQMSSNNSVRKPTPCPPKPEYANRSRFAFRPL